MKEAPRLEVCGHFQIHLGSNPGSVRRLRTRKTEWLCCYLAVQRGRWQSREALAERFWPDDDAIAARRKLRLALHSIRQSLGESLQSEGSKVRFDGLFVDALDQPAEDLDDHDLLLGEHDGTLSDLLPALESKWVQELTARLRAESDRETRARIALKLSSICPGSQEAASVLASPGPNSPIYSRRASDGRMPDSAEELLLDSLALHLLGGKEPAAAALIGPPGVGKTHLARRLMPLASGEEIIPLFISLQGVCEPRELESLLHQALTSSQGQSAPLQVKDLASTLVILDNADDLAAESHSVLDSLLCDGSPIRLLITLPENRFPGFKIFRHKPMALPKEASLGSIQGSQAARYLAQKAGLDLALTDPAAIYRLCLESGGLPLALQHCAKEILFASGPGYALNGRKTSVHHAVGDRLKRGYERLDVPLREALFKVALLGSQFHPRLAEALGISPEAISQLWERSWLQHSPDGRAFEILPSVQAFSEERRPASIELPSGWRKRLADLARALIDSNYLLVSEVFAPTVHLLDSSLSEAQGPPDDETGSLFSALYFCRLATANLAGVVEHGVRLYGPNPNPAWRDERALNFLGSAAFFHQDYDLAERIFGHLMSSETPKYRSLGHCNSGLIAQAKGHFDRAADLLAPSVEEEGISPRQRATRANNLAHALAGGGRLNEAESAALQTLAITQEAPELFEIRALAQVTLGGVSLLRGDSMSAADWADRALTSWGEEGQIFRRLEAVFLRLAAEARLQPKGVSAILVERLPRVRKGPPAAAGYWAPFAAGVICLAEGSKSGQRLLRGMSWPTTPFWLAPLVGSLPDGWEERDPAAPSNKERWVQFIESMKRL